MRNPHGLRVGEELRYDDKQDRSLPCVDGLPNFHFVVRPDRQDQPLPRLEAGINPIGPVRAPDGRRRPAVLIVSSTFKAGTEATPWQDYFDPDNGHILYFGDNKVPKERKRLSDQNASAENARIAPFHRSIAPDPSQARGNRVLLEEFIFHSSPDESTRMRAAPMIFFTRPKKGHVIFQGYGVVRGVNLVTQIDHRGRPFANYSFDFVVLSLANEGENFSWSWINRRRDSEATSDQALSSAPKAWRDWVKHGPPALSRLRRRVSLTQVVKRDSQKPEPGSAEAKVLQQIYAHYQDDKHAFEGLAAEVAKSILSRSGGAYVDGWITPRSRDGGRDFVGRLDLGQGFSSVKLVVLGQAKCERPTSATGGRDVARTVARLQRGWIGAYVTTSYFSDSVQLEIIEDRYPLLLINGGQLASAVLRLAGEVGLRRDIPRFLNEVDRQYEDRIRARRPEEILLEPGQPIDPE